MSIRGYVEGIKDGVFTDTDYAYDMILSETSRLEKLVNVAMGFDTQTWQVNGCEA